MRPPGSGKLEFEGFREVMRAIGAPPSERRGRLAALRSYGEDVGLARTALGADASTHMSRHELRVAGAVVRVLQRELYRAEDAAALLPALGLADPSEVQLRAAFRVFDLSGDGEALDAEYVREKLQTLVPQAGALIWGAAGADAGADARSSAAAPAKALSGGSARPNVPIELLSFEDFVAVLAQLRSALSSQALAAGVSIETTAESGWLSGLVDVCRSSASALTSLHPSEALLLSPSRLVDAGRLVHELEAAGVSAAGSTAIARALFLPSGPEPAREAFVALDLKRRGALPMARIRRLLPSLSRHLPRDEAEARIAAALSDSDEVRGIELSEFVQLLASLSASATDGGSGGGLFGDSLTGLVSIDTHTASRLSPLQLQRVGRIARRMRLDGYAPQAINTVVRVLFISSARADLERAFALLDKDRTGSLHAEQFRQLLFVAGERLPQEGELDEWFRAVDVDSSGRLELPEFTRLVRGLRRAITTGHRTTLDTLTGSLSQTVAAVTGVSLDADLIGRLSPLDRRRAGRVAEALQRAEFAPSEVRTITRALFDGASEGELQAAFAVFDTDGEGTLSADEFREMLPLLAGDESLPFARIESLFRQADRDRSGLVEFPEFVWLLSNLQDGSHGLDGGGGAPGGGSATHAHRYIKSVDELRADRLREAQQEALALRTERLRTKADVLTRASAMLHQELPLVSAELLMRLHICELEEARVVQRSDPHVPGATSDGLLLRGTPALLERRGEALLRALSSLAVEERDKVRSQLRQVIRSIDEELPVTETAVHGVARTRSLYTRIDRIHLVVETLSAPGGVPLAASLVGDLMAQIRQESEIINAAPATLARASEEQVKALRQRLNSLSQLKLLLDSEQAAAAKQHASTLAVRMRADAARVLDYATQGVYVAPSVVDLPTIVGAESVAKASRFAPRWARCKALLVAAEKVAQVLALIKNGRRRSLQEGVQLLVTMEEGDMPTLFTICREVMRATDAEQAATAAASTAPPGKVYGGAGMAELPKDPEAVDNATRARGSAVAGPGPAAAVAPASRTVWWHQIDEGDEESYDVRDVSEWALTRGLRRARLQLMNKQGPDGIAALEKLRSELLLFARDAAG